MVADRASHDVPHPPFSRTYRAGSQTNTLSLVLAPHSPDLAETLRTLVSDALSLTDAQRATLFVLDATSGALAPVFSVGGPPPDPEIRIPLNQGVIGYAAARRKSIGVDDASREPRTHAADLARSGALLYAPLVDDVTLLGVVGLAHDRPMAFSEKHQRVLVTLARSMVLAIASVRLAQENRAQRSQLTLLIDAARELTTLHDVQEVFGHIVEGITRLVDYEDAVIFAVDQPSDELRVVAGRGRHAAHIQSERINLQHPVSLSARVARQRRPWLHAPDVAIPPTGRVTEAFLAGDDLALLCVPLLSKDTLRGVVTLARKLAFDPADLRAMTELAPLIATALENVGLYSAVRTEQERLAAIFAGTSDGIAVVDATGLVTHANAAFVWLAGRPLEQVHGYPCVSAFGVRNAPPAHGLVVALQESARGQRISTLVEAEMPGMGTEPRLVTVSVSPIAVPGGFHAAVVARDVTELRAVERMKAQFLMMISHEIRNPLHALNGYLEAAVLQYQEMMDEPLKEMLRSARSSSMRLTGRVKDLFLLANADVGAFDTYFAPVDLGKVIAEAFEEVDILARKRKVALQVVCSSPAPTLMGDEERLEQVVRNLLTNAIKFTSSGGHVRVEVHVGAQAVEIAVVDTGCGIPAEYLPHIFERFYQVPASQGMPRSQGQGLGLAIVKMIVEQHGGWVQVMSTPGQGSRFILHLPLQPPPNARYVPLSRGRVANV